MAKPSACGYQTLTNPSASQNSNLLLKPKRNSKIQTHQECKRRDAALLRLTPQSNKGYNAIDKENRKYEIKSRRLTKDNPSRMQRDS
jgi:hypothetical protein